MILISDLDAPSSGTLFGPWRLLERVGSGGNGIVYRACLAENPGAGSYALKLAREPGAQRFEREAELLSRMEHPHVPRFVGSGRWKSPWGSEYPYLVMQWVEGVPLYLWATWRGVTSRQGLVVLAQVARALEATHRHGVHRDVKGDNVLVTAEGKAVLVDYGSCWYEGARPLTTSAVPPGTPPYRSGQCLRFEAENWSNPEAHYRYPPEDDVYALGVTAYYLVTGTYPPPGLAPGGGRPVRLIPPSELATVSPELEAFILRMLSERREERGTPGELAEAMEQAARSAGPEADARIRSSRSMLLTEEATRPGPPRWYGLRKRARRLAPVAALAAVVVLVLLHARQVRHEEPLHGGEASEVGVDERKVGLADAGVEVLASATSAPRVGMPSYVLALPMPKSPFPNQRKPPCDISSEVVVLDACWAVLAKKPPCGGSGYEYDGKCVIASFATSRQPTSEQP